MSETWYHGFSRGGLFTYTVTWRLDDLSRLLEPRFKVFKSPGTDTIKITLAESKSNFRLTIYFGDQLLRSSWNEVLHFYAYRESRPGTEKISVQ